MITVAEIQSAEQKIRPHIPRTPVELAPSLGDGVWLKLENVNLTHSFKVRGALNAMLHLSEAERARGIIAASSGNHAQGIAWAAQIVGATAQIVMPDYTARRKIAGVRRWGAEPIIHGATYDEAEQEARRLEHERGLTFISAYNDARVIAGAGTVGLEILDALPDVQRVIVPIGGGGLISGIATAIKAQRPDVEIIGVNAAESPDMYNHFYQLDMPTDGDTLADALAGAIEDNSLTLEIVPRLVDRLVLVSEHDIMRAMRWLVYEAGWVGEGGGVVGIAAILSHTVASEPGTVVVVSGGNVDADSLHDVLTGGN